MKTLLFALLLILAYFQAEAALPVATVVGNLKTKMSRGLRTLPARRKVSDLVCLLPESTMKRMKIRNARCKSIAQTDFDSDQKAIAKALSSTASLFKDREIDSPDILLDNDQAAFLEGSIAPRLTWPNGIIEYEVQPNAVPERLKAFIWASILYELNVGVDFQEKKGGKLEIRLDKGQTGRSCAHLGYSTSSTIRYVKLTTGSLSTAFHELGHTLGLMHEQQRHDRDYYVTVDMPPDEGVNYDKYDFLSDVLQYNFASIMHYSMRHIKAKGDEVAVEADLPYAFQNPDETIGEASFLNALDLASLRVLYPKNPVVKSSKSIEDCFFMKWVPPVTVHNKCDKLVKLVNVVAKNGDDIVANKTDLSLPQRMFTFITHKRANNLEITWEYTDIKGKKTTGIWKDSVDCKYYEFDLTSKKEVKDTDKLFATLKKEMPGTVTSFTAFCAPKVSKCAKKFISTLKKKVGKTAAAAITKPTRYSAWENPTITRRDTSKEIMIMGSEFTGRVKGLGKKYGYIDVAVCKEISEAKHIYRFVKKRKKYPMPEFFYAPLTKKISSNKAEEKLTEMFNEADDQI